VGTAKRAEKLTHPQPAYLRGLNVEGQPLNYPWIDASHREYWAKPVPPLERKVERLDDRAIVGFTASCAEWVAWRLSPHTDVGVLLDTIDAAWASIIDWRYFELGDKPFKGLEWDRWPGQTQRPLCVAARTLIEAVDNARRGTDLSVEAVCAASLVEHVLPALKAEFRAWRDAVLARLVKTNPADADHSAGKLVAPDAFDPDVDYRPGGAKKLLGTFLAHLDPKRNRFLRSPEKLRQVGFAGTPYAL
jgi:hypothetical protein